MFGKSSNAIKAMRDIQKLKCYGGMAKLSFSQIVCLISNSQDAKRNLTDEEYFQFRSIFELYRKQTHLNTVDITGYIKLCRIIIRTYEKYFPYMLVDGEHSQSLDDIRIGKIRQLYAEGYYFEDALPLYENEDFNSSKKSNDNTMKKSHAVIIGEIMENFLTGFMREYLSYKATPANIGIIFGIANTIYVLTAENYFEDVSAEEDEITEYTKAALVTNNYTELQIETIMEARKTVTSEYYQKFHGKPMINSLETIANEIVEYFSKINSEISYISVRQSLIDYQQKIFTSISSR